jgi:hypothetical protein
MDAKGSPVMVDGEPVYRKAMLLPAVDRLVKLGERMARLGGYDAPARADVTTMVSVRVEGVDLDGLS